MEWLDKGALPMGMVFMAFTVFGVLRRKAGHVLAARDYPNLGKRLGLEYRPSKYRSGVGTLLGELEGLRVIVDPDDQRSIAVRFIDQREPLVEMHTFEHNKRVPEGMRAFRAAQPKLQGWFKTSYAGYAEIEALEPVWAELAPLRSIRQLKTLSLTPQGLRASFDYGSPPFIPAAIVAEVVPSLVHVARALGQIHAEESPEGADSDENPSNSMD